LAVLMLIFVHLLHGLLFVVRSALS
jgi:hypothetical protein